MSLRIEPHAEPIPGYRLIERLGGGGFGEVWKAEAPGGLFKAIKFVYGEISIDDSIVLDDADGARAKQELKSLNRVKMVHHPYILSLERYDIIQGQLIIVMELADKTLWDRFKECRMQGLPGIPREELLGYMAETAEALDLMNTEYQLQHLDIKPQNVFLVFNHVKVADFGLVKDLFDKQNATITGGVTPVYAAPETFDGWLSRQSDQYSLAIVFQELLTGQRPFAGSTMKQLILHHLQSAPDLTLLQVSDRPIIAKALSKNPDDRYSSCMEFVRLLQKSTCAKTNSPDVKQHGNAPISTPLPMDTASSHTAGARGKVGPVNPAEPNFSTEDAFFGNRPQILPPRPEHQPDAPPRVATNHDSGSLPSSTTTPKPRKTQAHPSTQELAGLLQPALIIGLGQLGIETLLQLRRRIAAEFDSVDALPQLRMLAIDTDADTIQQAINDPSGGALRPHETVLSKLQRPSHYVKTRDGKLPTDSWLNPKLIYRIGREQNNSGVRALGRLAFVDNYRTIAKRLEAELAACAAPETLNDSALSRELGLRAKTPRVYVVTSLTGNTGSGMFLDVAYLAHKLLREKGHEDAEVVGLFFLPAVGREAGFAPALMNTYASLIELHHFSLLESLFSARYETASSIHKDTVTETGPAFHRCVLLSLPESRGNPTSATNLGAVSLAGDYLCRDLTTVLGAAVDELRQEKMNMSNEWSMGKGPLLHSFGMFRVLWPRHLLLEQCGQRLCVQLVNRWLNKDAKTMADTIRQWTQERWESLGMRSEGLIERFQTLLEHALQSKPEHILSEILNSLQEALCGPNAKKTSLSSSRDVKSLNMGPVVQAMERLEKVFGSPEENRPPSAPHVEPSVMEQTLANTAHVIADQCEQKLAELAVTLLEDPNYRLAGAEESLRQFSAAVEQSLQAQETLAKELTEKTALLHLRILQLIEASPQGASAGKPNAARAASAAKNVPTAADVFDLTCTYAKTRYHSMVLSQLNRLYISLRGHLSDQIREVGFCRQRLGELLGLLKSGAGASDPKSGQHAAERILYPAGCLEMKDVVERIGQEVSLDDLLHFDERVQAWITKHCQALLQVCMGSSAMVKSLAPVMLQEAQSFLQDRLRGASVAEMYFARKSAENEESPEEAILDDLERCHDEAAPELGRLSEASELAVVCLPNDEHGKDLQQFLLKDFPDLKILLTDRQDEMVFYREIMCIPWKELEQLGPIAQQAYESRASSDPSSLHSREDILEWQSPFSVMKRS